MQTRMNRKMVESVPELDSDFAATPLCYKEWKEPSDRLDDGTPCFVPMSLAPRQSPADVPRKRDYVWVPAGKDAAKGAGYYHLLTRAAYGEVLRRVLARDRKRRAANVRNALRLQFRSREEKEDDAVATKVVDLIKLRREALVPDDIHAYRMRLFGIKAKKNNADSILGVAPAAVNTITMTNLGF